MYHLNNSANFEQAIKDFCYETVSHWSVLAPPLDLTFVDLSKMEKLWGEINVLSGYLEEMVQVAIKYEKDPESLTIDEANIYATLLSALNNCYNYEAGYPFYDIRHFTELLVNGAFNSYTPQLVDISSRLNRAFTEAILCKQISKTILQDLNLSLGVTIANSLFWDRVEYGTAYPGLKFQQETGWGNWISVNPYYPTGNPNPDTLFGDEGESNGDEEGGDGNEGEEGEGEEGSGEEDEHDQGLTEEQIALILEIIRNR
jgi:hypothetical protein